MHWHTIQFPCVQSEIEHKVLRSLLDPLRQLYEDVRRKALMRLEYEGLHKADAITRPGGRFFEDPASFAMERYAYYVCYKCKKVGGCVRVCVCVCVCVHLFDRTFCSH